MKKYLGICALLAVAAAPVQAATVDYLMDFSGDICASRRADNSDGPVRACTTNGDTVALAYGDQPGVDVEWRRNVVTESDEGRFNIRGLGVDPFATIPSNLFAGSITLRALDGATVGLQGFDFAVGLLTVLGNQPSQFTITDLAGLFTTVTQTVASTNVSFDREEFDFSALDLTSTVGIEILLGTDASSLGWGIDNIAYSVTPAGTVDPDPPLTPIPLPASGVMLLAGLAGLAGLRRRLHA